MFITGGSIRIASGTVASETGETDGMTVAGTGIAETIAVIAGTIVMKSDCVNC